ncbi:MAG: YdeI/OmpD-associated family protein [Gemmatimonadota bacterium]|nr:YdeI/OmpD-associated family protein [Gemmatimonadota bacterium]
MADPQPDVPLFFASPGEFGDWLTENHDRADVQWVGYYKKGSGLPSMTWPESVDEALCFGWIDGLRKSIDGESYMIRFTPRRPGSHWSRKNLDRMVELLEERRVHSSGRTVYEDRNRKRVAGASYEQRPVELPERYSNALEAVPEAWAYYQAAAPSYRKQVSWWIVSAKREETRLRRLRILIDASAAGDLIPPLRWTARTHGK